MLLVHGFMCNRGLWSDWYASLAEQGSPVIAVNLEPMLGSIDDYVATGEPMGKAGGYAIQGQAERYVSRLCGSYSGVMGLPLQQTAALLQRHGLLAES